MNKGIFSLIGFTLFLVGMLSLVLSLVSVKLSFLVWIDSFGGGIGLLLKLIMIVVGIVIIVITRSDFEGKSGI